MKQKLQGLPIECSILISIAFGSIKFFLSERSTFTLIVLSIICLDNNFLSWVRFADRQVFFLCINKMAKPAVNFSALRTRRLFQILAHQSKNILHDNGNKLIAIELGQWIYEMRKFSLLMSKNTLWNLLPRFGHVTLPWCPTLWSIVGVNGIATLA